MAESKTQYIEFQGKASWAKIYEPDEFRGAVRWTLNLYMDDPEEWAKFQKLGIQKKIKEDENGKYFQVSRPTTKLMKGRLVHFTAPIVYDKNGETIVKYVDADGKIVRSYEDDNFKPTRVGDPVLIGNGSKVAVTLSVYNTAMGTGNRFESVKILDLIEYKRPDPDEVKTDEVNEKTPW